MKKTLCFLTVLFAIIPNNGAYYTKRWIHTNLWSDPFNWKPPQLPCLDGKVKMQDGTVFIFNETALPSKIILASDGKIVFARNSQIKLGPPVSSKPTEKCEESVFDARRRVWNNPTNWEVVDANRPVPKPVTDAVPYIERIPCKDDHVTFPQHNVFSVEIDQPVSVDSIELKETSIRSNNDLQVYLNSTDGKHNFKLVGDGGFQIKTNTCPSEGCQCRNYANQKQICGTFTCPTKTCTRKVNAKGDCCPHCGAIIEFEFDKGFVLESCQKAILNETEQFGVNAYVSRLNKTAIEILFTDGKDGKLAEEWMVKVGNDMKNKGHPCISKRINELTYKDFSRSPKNGDDNGATTKVTLGIIIPLIVIVIFIVGLAVYFRRRNNGNFDPKRFDDRDVSEYPGFNEVVTTDFMSSDYQPNPAFTTKDSIQNFSNPVFALGDLDLDDDPDNYKSAFDADSGMSNTSKVSLSASSNAVSYKASATPVIPEQDEQPEQDQPEDQMEAGKTSKQEEDSPSGKNRQSGFTNPLYADVYFQFQDEEDAEKKKNRDAASNDDAEDEGESPFKIYDDSDVVSSIGQYQTLYDEEEFE